MKIRKILSFLLVIVLCFVLAACDKSSKPDDKSQTTTSSESNEIVYEESNITPLLYRVTDDNGNVAWLFGSIHIGLEEFYPLPDYVLKAFDEADSLAVELDIIAAEKDMLAQTEALEPLMCPLGTTTKDYISEELYDNACALMEEYNLPATYMDYYLPVMWGIMLENAFIDEIDADTDLGIDRHLINRAYDHDKEILEIESLESQYEMLGSFSIELQELYLESRVSEMQNKTAMKTAYNLLLKLWSKGNEETLEKALHEEETDVTAAEQKLLDEYNQKMELDRNLLMTTFAENALASGNEVFICVGAAHVIGEDAMVELLRERGYTVEAVK